MTEKLYEVDSYVQNFTAQVVSCTPVPGGFAVVRDRTAFFPEGGGQPCDTGRLGGARVLAVHTDGETITHTTDAPLTAGETVDGCLDWPARQAAMPPGIFPPPQRSRVVGSADHYNGGRGCSGQRTARRGRFR